ncbi:hypothetical protein AAG747_23540 [Rapidithrix thailandica]|uniref:Uncharacterized protein n=1 Tax=Rapidithrix thailandica TaxID=413964 RepID=A0AAW9SD97_9BACT
MTPEDFNQLSLTEKGEIVFNHCEFIASREHYHYTLNLYAGFDYLIEVWYNDLSIGIEKIQMISNINQIYSYFEDVSLKEIENLI